jgi:hypothetical protein
MSNVNAEPKPHELTDEELDIVSGGSLSFSYGALMLTYGKQDSTGASDTQGTK